MRAARLLRLQHRVVHQRPHNLSLLLDGEHPTGRPRPSQRTAPRRATHAARSRRSASAIFGSRSASILLSVVVEPRAHGRGWSYRQGQCAREGSLVEYSKQRVDTAGDVAATGATVGAAPS